MNLRLSEHIVVAVLGERMLGRRMEVFEEGIKMDLKGADFDLQHRRSDSLSG
jgi:hypothetical protein